MANIINKVDVNGTVYDIKDTNQTVTATNSSGTITAFGANDAVQIKAGTNINSIVANPTDKTITINAKDTTYSTATTSADGLMSAADKSKLNGIASGAEVNQNAFSNVAVGSTTISADSKTDTLTLAAGTNISLSADATNDKVTINNTYSYTHPTSHPASMITGLAAVATSGSYDDLSDKPTSLPASNTVNTYSSTSTDPISGKGVAAALGTLDVASKGGTGKYIQSIQETDGKISATEATLDKSAVGLGNVDNKSSATIRSEITSSNVTTALGYTPLNSNLKGAASGLAELGGDGKVPSSQLPSYVDDVLEYDTQSSFPSTGETGKIYIAKDTNKTYRWSGTAYVEISASLALGETSSTAYRGDRGKTAYDHATDSSRLTTAKSSGLYKIATTAQGHVASVTAVAKSDITGLGIPAQDTTYSDATTSTSGLMSASDKTKLNGIATGAEVNQNAFSNVVIGSTTIAADSKTDSLTLVAGSNITLTPDATNDKVTITAIDTKYTHPAGNAASKSEGLYKISTDATSHVNSVTAVTKADITALGIPSQNMVAYGTCSTEAATAAKVATVADINWTLTIGAIIGIKFTATNTASNVTLNVNNTGAKSIAYGDTTPYTGTSSSYCGYANRVIYYMYDGTYWRWLNRGWTSDSDTIPSAHCTTSASTSAKTASMTYYTATANSYVHVNIRYANTAKSAITLNINSAGAKPIYINGTASSTTNYTLPAGSYIAYYDGTNYYFRTDGKLTASITGDAGTVGGHTVAINVPSDAKFTDTKVTAVGNHYTPSGGSALTPSSSGTASRGSTVVMTGLTKDAAGHITGVTGYTLPASDNTDTKVTQTLSTTNGDYPIILKNSTTATDSPTSTTNYTALAKINPSTGNLTISKINGNTPGTVTSVAVKMNDSTKGTVTTSGTIDLGTVLTAHQDISGKEDTSNKVTSWSTTTTDVHYPSEKLVKSALDGKANSSHTQAASTITGLATVATSGSYNDLSNRPTIPAAVTESTVSGWGFTKNTGTITGVRVNGTSIATSGVANITSVPASIIAAGALANGMTATTQSAGNNSTKVATTAYVDSAITALPNPMVFKGTLGSEGTITSLPTASSANTGHTYKVITAGTYASQAAKVGDMFISDGSAWTYVPSGDETDTWRKIKVNDTELLSNSISSGALNLKDGASISVIGSGNDVIINNAGVRGITQSTSDGHNLSINTGGAVRTITIPDNNTTYSLTQDSTDGHKITLMPSSGTGQTVTIPDNNTKNTAGATDTSSKIFLVGATSQAANPQTYSDNQVYATNGQLDANKVRVGEHCTLQYNTTTQALDFIFA